MYGVTYTKENNTLILDKHDCGLLSNASVIFNSLVILHQNIYEPINIYWPPKSVWNRDDRAERNVHELYFKTNKTCVSLKENTYFNAMVGDCNKFDFEELKSIRDCYFNLSEDVINRKNLFIKKYNINPQNTIAILYRGTDKIAEVPRVHPKYYLNPIKNFVDYKILLQTDQQQIFDYFKSQLKDKLLYIDEMPLTKTDQVMHLLPQSERHINNYELGLNYLAVISILSQCKYVVFDTNNAGLWICILRGGIKNTCQINATINMFNKIED